MYATPASFSIPLNLASDRFINITGRPTTNEKYKIVSRFSFIRMRLPRSDRQRLLRGSYSHGPPQNTNFSLHYPSTQDFQQLWRWQLPISTSSRIFFIACIYVKGLGREVRSILLLPGLRAVNDGFGNLGLYSRRHVCLAANRSLVFWFWPVEAWVWWLTWRLYRPFHSFSSVSEHFTLMNFTTFWNIIDGQSRSFATISTASNYPKKKRETLYDVPGAIENHLNEAVISA